MEPKEIKELFTINKEVNYEKALKYVCDEYNKLEVKLVERNLNLQSNWNSLREYLKNREDAKYYITEYRRYEQFINDILDKMNELEGDVKE